MDPDKPIIKGPTEAEEIAALLEKRAHCPHNFRYAILAEHKETHEETMYTWCQHCGQAQMTAFAGPADS